MTRKVELKTSEFPEKLYIQLSHYRQKFNWDCGLSCILMVLSTKNRQHFLKNFTEICKNEGFNRSTWTIDLSYLLRKYNVIHEYHTVTLGIHPGFSGNSFYKNILTKDEARVLNRFKAAEQNQLVLKQTSVSNQYILQRLIDGPVIVLTNARLLNCDVCKLNKLSSELRKCIPWPASQNYQGHYIVLCGYDIKTQKIFYRNPALNDHVCIMSLHMLEDARKSYGTDEDVIFVQR